MDNYDNNYLELVVNLLCDGDYNSVKWYKCNREDFTVKDMIVMNTMVNKISLTDHKKKDKTKG